MKKEQTCRDCRYWKDEGRTMACCLARNNQVFDDITPMCADFVGKDGSRPLFCRLASSVDEMAEAISDLLMTATAEQIKSDGFKPVVTATKKQEYLVGIKEWLMEVEKR